MFFPASAAVDEPAPWTLRFAFLRYKMKTGSEK
jgi:hypothetical protein